jgi:hypothetical protein
MVLVGITLCKDFYDCLKRYFHNIEFHKEQFLLGFKEERLKKTKAAMDN